MSAAWVAGTVRAKALARRRLGAGAARALAACPSLEEALAALVATPYRQEVRRGQTLAEAQRATTATLLWHLRVLAGWLPWRGTRMLRLLARWFEIANVDELLHRLAGGAVEEPFHLGALATAWPRLATAGSPAELRATLAASPWGDPGGGTPRAVQLGMRLTWVGGVAALDRAAPWAAGAAALLVARERFAAGHDLPAEVLARAAPLLGAGVAAAASLPELTRRLPSDAAWALRDATGPDDLWRAEARWWSRVERDGFALLDGTTFGPAAVLGTAAVLAVDAWRVQAALELAARGGRPLEVFDAMA
jgi:ATP synthase (C/AC39) subunit